MLEKGETVHMDGVKGTIVRREFDYLFVRLENGQRQAWWVYHLDDDPVIEYFIKHHSGEVPYGE
jgi:hypothetical protein